MERWIPAKNNSTAEKMGLLTRIYIGADSTLYISSLESVQTEGIPGRNNLNALQSPLGPGKVKYSEYRSDNPLCYSLNPAHMIRATNRKIQTYIGKA